MSLDLNSFPPAVRAKQIRLGEQFGSRDTLAQANQTLAAYAAHGSQLKGGFSAKDAARLAEVRDMLCDAGVGRDTVRGGKKVTSQAYADAVRNGQAARLTARSILTAVQDDLEESADPVAPEGVRVVKATLKQTATGTDEAEPLAKQLDTLSSALQHGAVAPAAADREGPDAVTKLGTAATALRQADQDDAGVRGTPVETQRLDQLDGIIVRLVRRARKHALAVGRETGNPALAEAFKLDKLYQSRAPSGREEDGEDDGEGEGESTTEGKAEEGQKADAKKDK